MEHANGKLPSKQPQPLHGLQAALHGRNNVPDTDPLLFTPYIAAVPTPQEVNGCASPPQNYAWHTSTAAQKHGYPWPKLAVLGVLAGEGHPQ